MTLALPGATVFIAFAQRAAMTVRARRRNRLGAREDAAPTWQKHGFRRSVAGSRYGTIKAAVSSGRVLR